MARVFHSVFASEQVEVLFSERSAWLEMVKAAYITEVDAQCAAIRRGLLSAAIPLPYLALTSSDSLELAIAGESTGNPTPHAPS